MSIGRKPKNLKQSNSRDVLELMRNHDKLTVADVSEKVKLSTTTVRKIFDSLLVDRFIVPAGKGGSTDEGGKKPELYCLNPDYGYTICIHVTPEKIIIAETDFNSNIIRKQILPVADERELSGLIERYVKTIEDICRAKRQSGQEMLGVSLVVTSLVDSVNGISIHSFFYPEWGTNASIVSMLTDRLGAFFQAPIYIDNANRYQTLAECAKGRAAGYKNFMIVDALPEGLGSGIVVNGVMQHGLQSIAGEIGHMTLARDGFPCACGNHGCFEALVSERRIVDLAMKVAHLYPNSPLISNKDMVGINLDSICSGVISDDPLCKYLIDDVVDWFVMGLGNVIMVNDPELIVIQGVYTKAGVYFLGRLRDGIRKIGLRHVEKKVLIEYSSLGEERGVIGGSIHSINNYLSAHVY